MWRPYSRLAPSWQAQDRVRGVILAFWSGEEIGSTRLGRFRRQLRLYRMDQIAAYVNFDMVGRMRDNKLTVQAIGSSSIWADLVDEVNTSFGFDVQPVSDPYLPTDVKEPAIWPRFRPWRSSPAAMRTITGRPMMPSTVNYPDLERVARYGAAIAVASGQ